jgi:hypothetical protein
MKQYVPPEQLWSADWGGDLEFEYDHETFWPALNEMCRKRREEKGKRWAAAGKQIGESEDYLAGGVDVSVTGFKYEAGKAAAVTQSDLDAVEEKLAQAKLEEKEDVTVAATIAA